MLNLNLDTIQNETYYLLRSGIGLTPDAFLLPRHYVGGFRKAFCYELVLTMANSRYSMSPKASLHYFWRRDITRKKIMQDAPLKPKAVLGIFYAFMSLLGLIFILLIPLATQPGPAGQGWWTQPALMPSLSLWLITLSATYLFGQHLLKLRQQPSPSWREKEGEKEGSSHSLRAELLQWLRPLEFFMYYLIYIWLLGLVGYFLSSLIFIVTLCLRVGLRSPKWIIISCLTAIALVAMFRWSLQVWIPPAALYDLFPKEARIFLMRNF